MAFSIGFQSGAFQIGAFQMQAHGGRSDGKDEERGEYIYMLATPKRKKIQAPKRARRAINAVAKRQADDLALTKQQAERELKERLERANVEYKALYAAILEEVREELVTQEIARLMALARWEAEEQLRIELEREAIALQIAQEIELERLELMRQDDDALALLLLVG